MKIIVVMIIANGVKIIVFDAGENTDSGFRISVSTPVLIIATRAKKKHCEKKAHKAYGKARFFLFQHFLQISGIQPSNELEIGLYYRNGH